LNVALVVDDPTSQFADAYWVLQMNEYSHYNRDQTRCVSDSCIETEDIPTGRAELSALVQRDVFVIPNGANIVFVRNVISGFMLSKPCVL